jgi:hypothetical protein
MELSPERQRLPGRGSSILADDLFGGQFRRFQYCEQVFYSFLIINHQEIAMPARLKRKPKTSKPTRKTLKLKQKTHHVGDSHKLDFTDVSSPTGKEKDTHGLLVDFVMLPDGTPKVVVLGQDKLHKIKAAHKTFTPQDVGRHTVFLVIFAKCADGKHRFLSHHTEEIHVIS